MEDDMDNVNVHEVSYPHEQSLFIVSLLVENMDTVAPLTPVTARQDRALWEDNVRFFLLACQRRDPHASVYLWQRGTSALHKVDECTRMQVWERVKDVYASFVVVKEDDTSKWPAPDISLETMEVMGYRDVFHDLQPLTDLLPCAEYWAMPASRLIGPRTAYPTAPCDKRSPPSPEY